MRNVTLDLRVHPDNPNVTLHSFLVEISNDSGDHLTAFILAQAWAGKWTNRKKQKAWNAVHVRLDELSTRTGLTYRVAAHGSRPFCEKVARENGWTISA